MEKLVNYRKSVEPFFGGGLNLYLNPSDIYSTQKSICFTVYKSRNQTIVEWDPYPIQNTSYQETIIFQLGFMIQFYSIKKNAYFY